jgi:hypothetical protein
MGHGGVELDASPDASLAPAAPRSATTSDTPMGTALLILHGLVGVALLGVMTHQTMSVLRRRGRPSGSFLDRYARVAPTSFTAPIVLLFVVSAGLGALIYPS